jgi:hypothetical protein
VVDLSDEMEELAEALAPATGAGARLVQFVAADPGEGVSTVARAFALKAAERAKRAVWLIELDLMGGVQYGEIAADPEHYGFLGKGARASPDGSCFFRIEPQVMGVDGRPWAAARYLSAYQVGGRKLWVTRFRREALRPGQAVTATGDGAYWKALRAHADFVVIDAQSLKTSRNALSVAPWVDANLLVVSADRTDTNAPQVLRAEIERAGGYCAGVVLNRAHAEPPQFLKAMLP